MAVPLSILLSHFAGLLFRFPRLVFGRLHRRRQHSKIRMARASRVAETTWWGQDRRWFPGGSVPRQHNRLTPLIDGEAAFAAILEAIRGAKEYVYIANWSLTPAFALDPDSADGMLVAVLAEVSERAQVKILVWSGSLLLFPPSQRVNRLMRDRLLQHAPRVDCRFDDRAHPTHCHHQKAVVVDGQVGFVGGLDLTTLLGNRWDVSSHPLRPGPNWHDVMLQIQGEAVADVQANFIERWEAVTGRSKLACSEPQVEPGWSTPCQIVRTIPRHVYPFARKGEFGIAHAYLAAIAQARRFVYLENQYIWSPEIVDALIAAMERNGSQFRIVVVLPARAYLGKYDNDRHVQRLRRVDGGRGMFAAYSLYSGGPAAGLSGFNFRPVYVHAKVAIIDDEWYTIGSANLNQRGLATDTEMNAQAIDGEGARALRLRLWAEHLGKSVEELATVDPVDVIDREFPALDGKVRAIVAQGWGILPGQIHSYQSGRMPGRWLLQELEGVLVEGL